MTLIWVKIKKNIFAILGFAFCYIIPLVIFGSVVNYTRDITFWTKFTIWAYLALGVFVVIVLKKIRERVIVMPHSAKRGILLSVFTLLTWLFLFGLVYGMSIIGDALIEYWCYVGVSLLIGRIFYILDEIVKST